MVDAASEIRVGMDITPNASASTHNAHLQNSALTYVGLCATHGWNIAVPNLICMLARALLGETESYVLSTSRIWEVFYLLDEFDSFTNQFHLAWWTYPGRGNALFTSEELDEAFEQYLLQVCMSPINFCIRNHCHDV